MARFELATSCWGFFSIPLHTSIFFTISTRSHTRRDAFSHSAPTGLMRTQIVILADIKHTQTHSIPYSRSLSLSLSLNDR